MFQIIRVVLLFLFLMSIGTSWYIGRRRKSVLAGALVAVAGVVLSVVITWGAVMIPILRRGLFPHGPP